jgi:hypothetical protein
MKADIAYLDYVIRHKWFVLVAGLKVGVPLWRLIKHDLTKLLPSESKQFSKYYHDKNFKNEELLTACLKHQNRNDHHWEYWRIRSIPLKCRKSFDPNYSLPMRGDAVREMVADWLGAARTYDGKWPDVGNWQWLKDNKPRIWPKLHQKTIQELELLLFDIWWTDIAK